MKYPAAFNPVTLANIALVCTAVSTPMAMRKCSILILTSRPAQIHSVLDDWETGVQAGATNSFTADKYQPIFAQHMATLLAFQSATLAAGTVRRLQEELYDAAR